MIHCGDSSFGGAMFGCEHCGNLKFVPFRCKSRFCPSCGTKYAIDRTTAMSFKLVNCIHRHCVFTIDEDLRIFIVSSLKVALAIPAYGGMLNISAIYFSVMLFVPLCLIYSYKEKSRSHRAFPAGCDLISFIKNLI